MNGNNIDFKPFCRVMKVLTQMLDKVSESVSNWEEIGNLEEIPADNRTDVENQLWAIFVYGEYFIKNRVKKMRSELSENPRSPEQVGKYLDYYRNKYNSFITKTKKLIDVSKAPLRKRVEIDIVRSKTDYVLIFPSYIDRYMGTYEYYATQGWLMNYVKSHIERLDGLEREGFLKGIMTDYDSFYKENRNIKASFENVIRTAAILEDYVANPEPVSLIDSVDKTWAAETGQDINDCDDYRTDYGLDKEYDEEMWRNGVLECLPGHLSNCQEIIIKPYFKPDNWIANEECLRSCISVPQTLEEPILGRIAEIYNSFIFSNWMSVIALSRCLLEYALVEKARAPEIQLPEIESKTLLDLSKEIGKRFPKLKKSMKFIRTEGNKVMHPPDDEAIENFPANKKAATRCINEITKIISTLYSKPKNSGNPFN